MANSRYQPTRSLVPAREDLALGAAKLSGSGGGE